MVFPCLKEKDLCLTAELIKKGLKLAEISEFCDWSLTEKDLSNRQVLFSNQLPWEAARINLFRTVLIEYYEVNLSAALVNIMS